MNTRRVGIAGKDSEPHGPSRQISLRLERSGMLLHTDLQQALGIASETLQFSERYGRPHDIAHSLFSVGICHLRLSSYAEGMSCLLRSLAMFEMLGDERARADVLGHIGDLYRRNGAYGKAYYALNTALELAQHVGDRSLECYALVQIGLADLNLTHYTSACDAFLRSLNLALEGEDLPAQARASSSLGFLYLKLGEFDGALQWSVEGLQLYRSMGYRFEEAALLLNTGAVYNARGDLDRALIYVLRAAETFREVGSLEHEGFALTEVAKLYARQHKLNKALYCQRKAAESLRTHGSRRTRSSALASMGYVYILMQRYDLGQKALNKSLAMAERLQDAHAEGECCYLLARLYEHECELAESVKYYKRYLEILTRIQEKRYSWALSERRILHEASLLHHNGPASARHGAIADSVANSVRGAIGSTVARLPHRDDAGSEDERTLLEGVMDMAHDELVRRISHTYPKLTPTEIKVCAMLKVNLSSKEIAEILNVSIHTVETHRRNIRKKIGLRDGENLVALLMGL